MRSLRTKRKAGGLCQLCGKPMPEGAKGILKERSYCSDCAGKIMVLNEKRKGTVCLDPHADEDRPEYLLC
jgi:predicted nucleic acid-binding Zn ribbon protein